MRFAIGCLLVIVVAVPAYGQPPIDGTYKSTDLGGTMLPGRFSESWTAPSGFKSVGNVTNKFSWDGVTLGTQWWMYCAQLFLPNLVFSSVDGFGNGIEIWSNTYVGGLCQLFAGGPWDSGGAPYTAPYISYTETQTYTFQNSQIVSITTNVSLSAQFIGFSQSCMSLDISNSVHVSSTDVQALPPNYPMFLDPACEPTRTLGNWGDSTGFTLTITGCTVGAQESTWGNIKALYE